MWNLILSLIFLLTISRYQPRLTCRFVKTNVWSNRILLGTKGQCVHTWAVTKDSFCQVKLMICLKCQADASFIQGKQRIKFLLKALMGFSCLQSGIRGGRTLDTRVLYTTRRILDGLLTVKGQSPHITEAKITDYVRYHVLTLSEDKH